MEEYTTTEYLEQLVQDKSDLVTNLTNKGISGLTGDETFTELVPEVLNIPSGGGSSSFAPTHGISFNTNYSQSSGSDTTTTTLDFTGLDTSNMTSMRKMFCNMRGLTSLDLSSFNTGSATDLSYMFYYCNKLTSINLSNFNTSKVTNMSYMFNRCSALTSINLSHFDTSSVTNISNMFAYAGTIGTLSLIYGNDWNTSNVTNMSGTFRGISNTTLDLSSNWDTSSVTDMSYMFANCANLSSLDVSNFDTSNVTTMNYMFANSTSLVNSSSIIFGNSWNTSNVTTMIGMFQNDTSLTSIDLSSWNVSSLISTYIMFNGCTNIEEINLSNLDLSNITNAQQMFKDCTKLKKLTLGKIVSKDVTVYSNWLQNCPIEELTLDYYYTWGNSPFGNYPNNMFYHIRTTLKKLVVNNLDNGVNAFLNSSLTSIIINSANFHDTTTHSNWIELEGMFAGSSNLTTVDISNLDTRNVNEFDRMFYNCPKLTTITFGSNFTFEGVYSRQTWGNVNEMFLWSRKLDNDTLNAILHICTTIGSGYTGTKTLAYLGIDSSFDNFANIPNLSNYQEFIDAGWTIS